MLLFKFIAPHSRHAELRTLVGEIELSYPNNTGSESTLRQQALTEKSEFRKNDISFSLKQVQYSILHSYSH